MTDRSISRRSLLAGAGAASLAGMGAACRLTSDEPNDRARTAGDARGGAEEECTPTPGLVFGSSAATWQLSDAQYRRLFTRHAEILFTEDDLLWYRLLPRPGAELDFTYGDRIIRFAERNDMLVFGAHLVWDEGFGEGWTDDDLWGMDEQTARDVLFGTLRRVVARYRGRVDAWSVANEVIANGPDEGLDGLRTDVPWYETIGSSYVAEAFEFARAQDPDAVLVLNEFGFETTNEFGDDPVAKREAALQVVDRLLADGVPVDAFGVQAHLFADDFAERFDADGYRSFLSEVADRGPDILITELDVLDDGVPADPRVRDRVVADAYRTYLDVALEEPAVKVVMTFGLSDRYTWLQEDFPRADGAPRRPLPFDEEMRPKPAFRAIRESLNEAPPRCQLWGDAAAAG